MTKILGHFIDDALYNIKDPKIIEFVRFIIKFIVFPVMMS